MKKLCITALLVLGLATGQAQIRTPQASPAATVDQVVGLTDVKIDYHRPSARGRSVYGELVPFGRVWRTGANENTTISFSDDVKIMGKTLAAGKYALYTQPKADSWDIIFYTDSNNWGLPEKWDESKEAMRVTVKPEFLSRSVETLTIGINNMDYDHGYLEIAWEKTMVSLRIDVPTQETTLKNINTVLAGPTADDLFTAAQYYYQSGLDMNKALAWVNQAIDKTPEGEETPFFYLRQKSLIQAKLGDKKGAIETAKLSLAGAEKANNAEYVKMNKDSIQEWTKK